MQISLKAARVNKDITQEEFAKAVGVNRKTVASWELGKTKPNTGKIDQICNVLNVRYDDLDWSR
jgi:DNA-binding XRE family transcriptional regulator